MPRRARKHSESGVYHVILRGINRQDIFEDDEDRLRFIDTIRYYKKISDYEIFAYCLMSNHMHLLIKEVVEPISTIMQRINGSYGIWLNQKYDRCGHLFQGRFKSEPVEDNVYFITALRYIHQNPVKAGLISRVSEWKWSSINEYYQSSSFIDTNFPLGLFSEDRNSALEKMKLFMDEENDDECLEYEDTFKITDDELRTYFATFGIKNIHELQQIEKGIRNELIKKLKAIRGVTVRQLARITGISKSVISRI